MQDTMDICKLNIGHKGYREDTEERNTISSITITIVVKISEWNGFKR